jgi:phytoene synthase
MAIRSLHMSGLEPLPGAADEARDLAACQALLANGSRTFLAASRLLPRAVRDPACALYAFCRLADDEVDGQTGGGEPGHDGAASAEAAAQAAVGRLRHRLALVYQGRPMDHAADRALAAVVRRFGIPSTLPEALIEGFEWDAAGRRYETLADVQAYAARVAGTVGAMMALLMGVRTATGLARACDLGVAMQLSNIARDVGEDARLGRLYLPRQWLVEAGIDPDAWLAAPCHTPELGQVVQRLLREADVLYKRVDAGVANLPLGCRPGINAARFLYAQIGLEVERRGLNPIDSRAVVSRGRKASSLLRALLTLLPDDSHAPQPPLAATRHLVEAVTGPLHDGHFIRPAPRRLAFAIHLFDKLERRERGWAMAE